MTQEQDIETVREALIYAGEIQQFSVTKPLEALGRIIEALKKVENAHIVFDRW